ncbi:acyltransferase family protein [Saccharicrinis fermentans]|uniref:Glucans biosynthesis protein C n=1 Tax=Saccharicrinis fermentans DSM 9555 = JCM 21142 TaxID=869213 RepID=W7YGM5_9BACT|nr:acyltransferase family protein [Saccharicrinis fermentans]GAF01759.1 glucans biosynthesis protein C [Saccharicrinis fermentans DSM 9555 = JCM 21142]
MRRYDLDWLRVLVFVLLIFYHVGMFFVPWEFHIKNQQVYPWLKYPMWFLNQWRLPILFVISGMGTYYALQKRTGKQFVWERIKRLYIPLNVGLFFIVPPQVYIERLVKNQFVGTYFEFWPAQAFKGIYPNGNMSWHHLWFLPYLLLFSLMLVPVFLYLKNHIGLVFYQWMNRCVSSFGGLVIFVIPLFFIEFFMEPLFPVTHALVGDWFTIIKGITLFLYGFLLMTVKESFWSGVAHYRRVFFLMAIFTFVALLLAISLEASSIRLFILSFLKAFNLWFWILALFGFAARYLNKENKVLRYCNEAVYPFYILHQTFMLVIAYFLIDINCSAGLKAIVMIIGTMGLSWLFYEFLIRRWKYIRPLFGLKRSAK